MSRSQPTTGKPATGEIDDKPGPLEESIPVQNDRRAKQMSAADIVGLVDKLQEVLKLDSAQRDAKIASFLADAQSVDEVETFEKDPLHWETHLGRDGHGGWFEDIRKHIAKAPSLKEKPLAEDRHLHLEQTASKPHSIFQALLAIMQVVPGAMIDMKAPALGPNVLRIIVACLKDSLKAGTRLSVGTCVTEEAKYGKAYEGVLRMVEEEWGLKGALRLYFFSQMSGFASPHRKPVVIVFPDGTGIFISTSANLTDPGLGIGVPFTSTRKRMRRASKSLETLDAEFYDIRGGPQSEGWKRLELAHSVNQDLRGEGMFVWFTPSLRRSCKDSGEYIAREVSAEDEKRYKEHHVEQVQKRLAAPLYTDPDVENSIRQTRYIQATASKGGVNLKAHPSIVEAQPFMAAFSPGKRADIQKSMSVSFSLMPRSEARTRPVREARKRKKRWRTEAEDAMDLSEEARARLKQNAKPLSVGTGPGKSYAPQPRLLKDIAARTALRDAQENGEAPPPIPAENKPRRNPGPPHDLPGFVVEEDEIEYATEDPVFPQLPSLRPLLGPAPGAAAEDALAHLRARRAGNGGAGDGGGGAGSGGPGPSERNSAA
ncbi:hypothetical protein JCM10449v2_005421 [Rhodotorula kratochvilovae]